MLNVEWTEHRFRSMGTQCHIVLDAGADGGTELASWAAHEAARLQRCWSRFDPDSELCWLNDHPSAQVDVSATLGLALDRATQAHRLTDGRFDPAILDDLERWGYDRTFAEIQPGPTPGSTASTPGHGGFDQLRLDTAMSTVTRPVGMRIDLGGIGKGLAADLIAEGLVARGATSVCVSMGGDLRVAGRAPAAGWPVPVEHPLDESVVAFEWSLGEGSIVTSTTRFRRWMVGTDEAHHIIDPRTHAPARTGVAAVIVADSTAWRAEVIAKAALVAGPVEGLALIDRSGVTGWIYTEDGAVHEHLPAPVAAASGPVPSTPVAAGV